MSLLWPVDPAGAYHHSLAPTLHSSTRSSGGCFTDFVEPSSLGLGLLASPTVGSTVRDTGWPVFHRSYVQETRKMGPCEAEAAAIKVDVRWYSGLGGKWLMSEVGVGG